MLTPFPELIQGFFSDSMLKRACENNQVAITIWDLRQFTTDKHKSVDDYPYGGGAGMVMKPEPIFRAMDHLIAQEEGETPRVILMTPQGEGYTQKKAEALAKENWLIFICGHYRGVDERVAETLVQDEISIGDYILTGGELPAAVVIDSVVRLIPGVLGNMDSAEKDSFVKGILDYPHYTRPEEFRGMTVPEVLLSGHHEQIETWRKEQALKRTRKRRPDLLKKEETGVRRIKNKE